MANDQDQTPPVAPLADNADEEIDVEDLNAVAGGIGDINNSMCYCGSKPSV